VGLSPHSSLHMDNFRERIFFNVSRIENSYLFAHSDLLGIKLSCVGMNQDAKPSGLSRKMTQERVELQAWCLPLL